MSETSFDLNQLTHAHHRSAGAGATPAPASSAPTAPAAAPMPAPKPAPEPVAEPVATPAAAPSGTTPPVAPAGPSFETGRPSLAERLNLRVLLFLLVVLTPVVALGYIYFQTATSDGVSQLTDGTKLVDLQKMSSFVFDQRNGTIEDVPEQWRALDGQKVALDGEMFGGNSAAGQVSEFDLVYSIANCCYTDKPQVQHFVRAKTADGKTVPFVRGLVRAKGTLNVEVARENGVITGVYHLTVDSVEPLQ